MTKAEKRRLETWEDINDQDFKWESSWPQDINEQLKDWFVFRPWTLEEFFEEEIK